MLEVQTRHCLLKIWPETHYLETVYPDGTRVPAVAEPNQEYLDRARALGYGDDTWALCREHETSHTLIAEARGLTASAVLWGIAHDTPVPEGPWGAEERIVLAFQGWRNGDYGEPLDILEEAGWDTRELVRIREQLVQLLSDVS